MPLTQGVKDEWFRIRCRGGHRPAVVVSVASIAGLFRRGWGRLVTLAVWPTTNASRTSMNTDEAKAVIEAALLSAPQPLSMIDLRRLFDDALPPESIRSLLDDIGHVWQGKSLRLIDTASGWRFQTAPEFARFLDRLHGEKPPKYSRAVMETLAIIAYRQPVTRGDIEEIRGVMVSSQIIRTLEERGWIDVIGHKDTVGRPALFGTTKKFLEDMGLRSISQLPALDGASPPELPAQQTIDFEGDQAAAHAVSPEEALAEEAPAGEAFTEEAFAEEAFAGEAAPDGGSDGTATANAAAHDAAVDGSAAGEGAPPNQTSEVEREAITGESTELQAVLASERPRATESDIDNEVDVERETPEAAPSHHQGDRA